MRFGLIWVVFGSIQFVSRFTATKRCETSSFCWTTTQKLEPNPPFQKSGSVFAVAHRSQTSQRRKARVLRQDPLRSSTTHGAHSFPLQSRPRGLAATSSRATVPGSLPKCSAAASKAHR